MCVLSFSFSYQSLVLAMLNVDPRKRPTASDICKHPWFSNIENLPNVTSSSTQDYQLVRVRNRIDEKFLCVKHDRLCSLKNNLNATFNAINAKPTKSLTLGPLDDSNLFKRRNERTTHSQHFERVK
jgi:serine/threonine protein kinase